MRQPITCLVLIEVDCYSGGAMLHFRIESMAVVLVLLVFGVLLSLVQFPVQMPHAPFENRILFEFSGYCRWIWMQLNWMEVLRWAIYQQFFAVMPIRNPYHHRQKLVLGFVTITVQNYIWGRIHADEPQIMFAEEKEKEKKRDTNHLTTKRNALYESHN